MSRAGRVERHLTASLGRPSLVTEARDPATGRAAGFRVATFDDQPAEGAFTLVTIGLCDKVEHELVVCAWNTFRDDALRQLVFALGHYIVESRNAAAPGIVFELPEPFVAGREWRHVFAFFPLYHDERLVPFEETEFVWLIPITGSESAYIDTHGAEAFDTLLEEHDPDLLDLGRESIV